jgi:hypothetical protein
MKASLAGVIEPSAPNTFSGTQLLAVLTQVVVLSAFSAWPTFASEPQLRRTWAWSALPRLHEAS